MLSRNIFAFALSLALTIMEVGGVFVEDQYSQDVTFSWNSPNGTVVTRSYDFPVCSPTCIPTNITNTTIMYPNGSYYNPPNGIPDCNGGSIYVDSIVNCFCWNSTDLTIRATSMQKHHNITIGIKFIYELRVANITCYLFVEIDSILGAHDSCTQAEVVAIQPSTSSQDGTVFTTIASSSSTIATPTQAPVIDVQITSDSERNLKTELNGGNGTVELQCKCTLPNIFKDRVACLWLKGDKSLESLSNGVNYTLINYEQHSNVSDRLVLFRNVMISVRKTTAQGYYRCLSLIDNRTNKSIKTLLWFQDVASMKLEVEVTLESEAKLGNETSISASNFDRIFNASLFEELSKRNLTKDKFDLHLRGISTDAGVSKTLVFEVFYRDVDDSEKLRICQIVINGNISRTHMFNLTSLDCCPSTTLKNVSTGDITWPVTIHDPDTEAKCPSSEVADGKTAYRRCTTNFETGPVWGIPQSSNCSQVSEGNINGSSGIGFHCNYWDTNHWDSNCSAWSEITRTLAQLSMEQINEANRTVATKILRKLTDDPLNLTSDMDIEFSTQIIENVMNASDTQNEVLVDILRTTSNLMNVDEAVISSSQKTSNTSTRLLKLLERLSDEIHLTSSFTDQQENLAIGIYVVKEINVDKGLNIYGYTNKTNKFPLLKFTNDTRGSLMDLIVLTPSFLSKMIKIRKQNRITVSSFLFKKSVFFYSKSNGEQVKPNCKIISVKIKGVDVKNLKGDEEIHSYFKPTSFEEAERIKCVYWNFFEKGGRGNWSMNGCRKVGMKNGMLLCKCSHMTNYAILLDVSRQQLSTSESKALSVVSHIGCAISLFSLVITIATYASSWKLRQLRPNKILLCLSSSLMMTMIIFLCGNLSVHFPIACQVVAALLHYFVLATFCWMAVEALNMYLSFVIVLHKGISKFMIKASLFAWGIPFVVVSITTAVSMLMNYQQPGSKNWICMVGGITFYIAYLSPICLILTGNLIILIVTVVSLGHRTSSVVGNYRMNKRAKTRMAIMLSVLLGCTWIFGLLAIEDLAFTFQLLFCVFNSLQGFFIFFFFCLRNEEARAEWRKLVCKCNRNKVAALAWKKSEGTITTMQLNDRKSELNKSEFLTSEVSEVSEVSVIQ